MNIILGVTGSIAAYKCYDLARLLVKNKHVVKIILTQGALEFIKPETFNYLGVHEVFMPHDDFTLSGKRSQSSVLHIDLVKWADKILIAPASANTLSRLALGITNDLLSTVFLANKETPVIFFPAMNTHMWTNKRTQEHINKLSGFPHVGIISPDSGLLACGDIGSGKLPDPQSILELSESYVPGLNQNKTILVTAGATVSPLDPVRYLTNPSSGKMGIEVAKAFLSKGYQVQLIAGHQCSKEIENLRGHPQLRIFHAPTTQAMKEIVLKIFPECHLYISTGAIADIEFDVHEQKLKKEQLSGVLHYRQAPDILGEVLKIKSVQKIISFAAETSTTPEVFEEKLKRKPVDLMIGNPVSNGLIGSDQVEGFQSNDGTYYFIESGIISPPVKLMKRELAFKLVKWFEEQDK
jgi:phosphopantothenoylcysteine decarboxylase / phosphopantothenate---cysteine ligase